MNRSYWTSRPSRRTLLRTTGLGLAGIAGASLLGCGGDDDTPGTATATATAGTATASATASGSPVAGGAITVPAYLQGPQHWDIFTSLNKRVQRYGMYVYSPLLAFAYGEGVEGFAVEPHLAESVEYSDPSTLLLKLRQGVKFHNIAPVSGRELVAEDVVYSLERRMAPESPHYGAMFNLVESVRAVDDYTVELKLTTPFAPAVTYLATMHGTVAAAEAAPDGNFEAQETAIGTGPWILSEWENNVRVKYNRNEDYFLGPRPYADTVEDLVINSTATISALRSGQILFDSGNWEKIQQAGENFDILESMPNTLIGPILTMRTDKEPFNDERVRQAISLSVDRSGILDSVYGGRGYYRTPLPAGFGDMSLPVDQLGNGAQWYEHDVQRAVQLMDAAGLKDGFDTKISSISLPDNVSFNLWLDVIPENLREIGIRAAIELDEYAVFVGKVNRGEMDAMGYTTGGGRQDPDSLLYGVYHSTGAEQNYSHVSDAALDAKLEAQRVEVDRETRTNLIHDIQRDLADAQYIVHLVSSNSYVAIDKKVRGYGNDLWGPMADSFQEGMAMANWWFDA